MAQVLEFLSRQAAAASAAAPAPILPQVPYPPSPRGDQGEWEEAPQLAQEDRLSIAPSWDRASFSGMEVGGELVPLAKAEPSFKVSSEASAPPLLDSTSALMGRTAAFLQVPWTQAAEPHWSVFRTQTMAPRAQKFPFFLDFMEEVRFSWDRPASAPSVLKQATQLASLEGADKPGLAGFPLVDSTIAALVKATPVGVLFKEPACLNPQCRVTETHLKRAYTAEA
ncbi:UNVERIFIED_CONTAM: hypothetical protein FKN15_019220 [Acipenser sinensis]